MVDKRDESEESEAAAEADVLGNDDDTEKGEIPAADAADDAEAKGAKPDAKAEASDEADAKAEAAAKAEAEADADADAKDEADAKADATKPKPGKAAKDKGGGSKWWLVLLAVLVAEFYVYGRRGEIEVCVGKQDVHDFSLMGQERTDENRWKFPRCESRVNLGLRSQYDELIEDGTNVACRGATLFRNRGEGPQCASGSEGWTTQIETSYIWPWDSRYYKHLLWFLFD
jgi:hypothetical protein